MTDPQLRFRQLLETTRHNRAQEDNWIRSLGETIRHDQEQERLSQYQTDTQASTSRYSADRSATASILGSQLKAESTKYSADTSASASTYRTDVESRDRNKRLDFDKYTQAFNNQFRAFEYNLEKLRTEKSIELQNQQIAKLANDMEVALGNLTIAGEQLELNRLRTDAQNALDRARKWESYSKTGMNVQQITRTIAIDAVNIYKTIKTALADAKDKLAEETGKKMIEDENDNFLNDVTGSGGAD